MADQKLTALSEVSAPALTDITYWVADPAGTPASDKISGTRLGGLFVAAQCQGRLTTESGVPVSTSDRTAQGTLYWTPCTTSGVATASGLVGFYDGTRYVVKSLTELSLSLTVTSGKNYDVFLDYNSGTPQLALSAAWTNDTTRADALATQGPFVVKSGSTSLRWVGTIRASGSNVIADSGGGVTSQVGGQRFVWNAYNAVPRHMSVYDSTSSWTYGTNTWRQLNNTSGNKVEYVCGGLVSTVEMIAGGAIYIGASDTGGAIGIGIDSTSANSGIAQNEVYLFGSTTTVVGVSSRYNGLPGLGYHYIAELEIASRAATVTFVSGAIGATGSGVANAGLTGKVMA